MEDGNNDLLLKYKEDYESCQKELIKVKDERNLLLEQNTFLNEIYGCVPKILLKICIFLFGRKHV